MIAIGAQLLTLGYDVAISLAEPYAPLATAAGLTPYSLVDRQQFDEMLSDPAMWKQVRGMHKVIRGIAAGFLDSHFEVIRSLHRPGRTVLVSHPLDFAARIFRDVEPSTPLVDVHLAPIMLRNPKQPADQATRTFRDWIRLGGKTERDREILACVQFRRRR